MEISSFSLDMYEDVYKLWEMAGLFLGAYDKIGRASCRERV